MSDLAALEEKLGTGFKNKELLKQALTHSSYANDRFGSPFLGNERLEFLGDAVLELAVSKKLYELHKDMPEGELTKFRASLVCEPALAAFADSVGLSEHLLLGKGEELGGGRSRNAVKADALEAVIGAAFADGGIEAAFSLVYRLMEGAFERKVPAEQKTDSKTILQEKLQEKGPADICYRIIGESGPDHMKNFTAAVFLGEKQLGTGTGKTKKAAEAAAAEAALSDMR